MRFCQFVLGALLSVLPGLAHAQSSPSLWGSLDMPRSCSTGAQAKSDFCVAHTEVLAQGDKPLLQALLHALDEYDLSTSLQAKDKLEQDTAPGFQDMLAQGRHLQARYGGELVAVIALARPDAINDPVLHALNSPLAAVVILVVRRADGQYLQAFPRAINIALK